MVRALGGHLGLVGNRQHLGVIAQGFEELADDLCRAAADAHVCFVEHQAGGLGGRGGNHQDGQANAGKFAAGGDLPQGARAGALPGGDLKFDLFLPMTAWRRQGRKRHGELGGFHAQPLQLDRHLPREGFRGVLSRLA